MTTLTRKPSTTYADDLVRFTANPGVLLRVPEAGGVDRMLLVEVPRSRRRDAAAWLEELAADMRHHAEKYP